MGKTVSDNDNVGGLRIGNLLPSVLLNPLSKSIYECLFDRHLTKQKTMFNSGIIGDDSGTDSSVGKIQEANLYDTKNQLQPAIFLERATENKTFHFRDFVNVARNYGIDIERLDFWAKSLSFNFIPPVDIDKVINFTSYYWDVDASGTTTPDYVTIKNKKLWLKSRVGAFLDAIVRNDESVYSIDSVSQDNLTVTLNGNLVSDFSVGDEYIIFDDSKPETFTKTDITTIAFDPVAKTTLVTFTKPVSSGSKVMVKSTLRVYSVDSVSNTVNIKGKYDTLFNTGYIGKFRGSVTTVDRYFEVSKAEYDLDRDITKIFIVENVLPSFDWRTVDISIIPELARVEDRVYNNVANEVVLNTSWDSDISLFEAIWGQYARYNPATIYATPSFPDNFIRIPLNTPTINNLPISDGDYVVLVGYGDEKPIRIVNVIEEASTYKLEFDEHIRMFDTVAPVEVILLKDRREFFVITAVEPNSPNRDSVWVDTLSNFVRTFDGVNWVNQEGNISVVLDYLNDRYKRFSVQSDGWSSTNFWRHKNDVTNFQNMIQAQMPIIEFWPHLGLSETSFTKYVWKYRKDKNSFYEFVESEPSLMDLVDIRLTDISNIYNFAFLYQTDTKILLHESFGNMVGDLNVGDVLSFSGFNNNDGDYVVVNVEYGNYVNGKKYRTRITLDRPVPDLNDYPLNAAIKPSTTSMGDPFESHMDHWLFVAIEDVVSSSVLPVENPMTQSYVGSLNNAAVTASDGNQYTVNSYYGLNYQEYALELDPANDPVEVYGLNLWLHDSLRDMCLYEDYQEGDIRVYVNGVRQYGNFEEYGNASPQSSSNTDFVTNIRFDADVPFRSGDVIRIEVGEAFSDDIGRADVEVVIDELGNTSRLNIVRHRKIEQVKRYTGQEPEFRVFDVFGNPLNEASKLFSFVEDVNGEVNYYLQKRIGYDPITRDYSFNVEMFDKDGSLLCYVDEGSPSYRHTSVWNTGGRYASEPQRIENEWDIIDQFKYNVEALYSDKVNLTQLYKHFDSILKAQSLVGVNRVGSDVAYISDSLDYGRGGTIKMFNDGFGLFLSMLFANIDLEAVLKFAAQEYANRIISIKENIVQDFADVLINGQSLIDMEGVTSSMISSIYDSLADDSFLDRVFGDSTTSKHIKNWVSSMAHLGMVSPVTPVVLFDEDGNGFNIRHHDGHYSTWNFSDGEFMEFVRLLKTGAPSYSGVVIEDSLEESDPLPTNRPNGDNLVVGDLLIRTSSTGVHIFRINTFGMWERIELVRVLSDVLLDAEHKLFDAAKDKLVDTRYDCSLIENDQTFKENLKDRFEKYVVSIHPEALSPYTNDYYDASDPWTWNYYHSTIQSHPVTGDSVSSPKAYWAYLYKEIYGTPYPNMEPWVLQGYTSKPDWWDSEYRDTTGVRTWKKEMWENIVAGRLPNSYLLPNSELVGDGTDGEISPSFNYLPVNVSDTPTVDGIAPDGLIPPYWNSTLANNSITKPLFDSSLGTTIVTPNQTFKFGHGGKLEFLWAASVFYLYDKAISAYLTDPIKYLMQNFDGELVNVACLQVDASSKNVPSHRDTVFHGETLPDGNVYEARGLNQWIVNYHRFYNLDDKGSDFRQYWKEWRPRLSYSFKSFIDTATFEIYSDRFDVSEKDYRIITKQDKSIQNAAAQNLQVSVLRTPSKYYPQRDEGKGFTFAVKRPFDANLDLYYRLPESVNFRPLNNSSSNTFRIESYEIVGAGVEDIFGYQILSFGQTLRPSTVTEYVSGGTATYTATVTVDGGTSQQISLTPTTSMTVEEVISFLNGSVSGAIFTLVGGDIRVESLSRGASSTVDVVDGGLFVSMHNSFTGVGQSYQSPISFDRWFIFSGNLSDVLTVGDPINVVGSTNFNGTYTVAGVEYDVNNSETYVFVDENVQLTDTVVDGFMEPVNFLGFPNNWVTGTEVYFQSESSLPTGLENDISYFISLLNEREFTIHKTYSNAKDGTDKVSVSGTGVGVLSAARLKTTFNTYTLDGKKLYWKIPFYRDVAVRLPVVIHVESIQSLVDLIFGYADYLESVGITDVRLPENIEDGEHVTWLSETIKTLESVYNLENIGELDTLEYNVIPDPATNSFKLQSSTVDSWEAGTPVKLTVTNGILPDTFDTPPVFNPVYYVIKTTNSDVIQLAYTKSSAIAGDAIKFNNSGSGDIKVKLYKEVKSIPSFELRPFRNVVSVEHSLGVLADVYLGGDLNNRTNQRIYNSDGTIMYNGDAKVIRRDMRSTIHAREGKEIAAMNLAFDGYEHTLLFNPSSITGRLIYDSFIGISTKRFYVQFHRATPVSLRPNISGHFLLDNALIKNMENLVDSSRYYYDSEKHYTDTVEAREMYKTMGFDGFRDYMDDLRISKKSQFKYWRGLIQDKGTNSSINAFTQQNGFEGMDMDEFWAMRLESFGDSKEKEFYEMRLRTEDSVKESLKVEFTLPDMAATEEGFTPVAITDEDRWVGAIDIQGRLGYKMFFFNAKIVQVDENLEGEIYVDSVLQKNVLRLKAYTSDVYLTYVGNNGQAQELVNGIDYEHITNDLVVFSDSFDINLLNNLTSYHYTYDYDAHNPSQFRDDANGVIVDDVVIWNPRLGHYDPIPYGIVDMKFDDDPAKYSNFLHGTTWSNVAFWHEPYVGKVWMETKLEEYVPYNDKGVFKDVNDRIANWGKMYDIGGIRLHEWTESVVPPTEYNGDGEPSKWMYAVNYRAGWLFDYATNYVPLAGSPAKVEPRIIQFHKAVFDTSALASLNIQGMVRIFFNGVDKLDSNFVFVASQEASDYLSSKGIDVSIVDVAAYINAYANDSDFITIVENNFNDLDAEIRDKLVDGDFDYLTPYTEKTVKYGNSGKDKTLYYFWTRNRHEKKSVKGQNISIFEAEHQLNTMTRPYKIIEGFVGDNSGFGLVYGNVFDQEGYDAPFRYSRMIVRGLDGRVNEDGRYTLMLQRNFTYRDGVNDYGEKVTKHWEWKLFRENQFDRVEEEVWTHVVQAFVGKKVINRTVTDERLPSFEREFTDSIYKTDYRWGIREGQLIAPSDKVENVVLSILQSPDIDVGFDVVGFMESFDLASIEGRNEFIWRVYDLVPIHVINMIWMAIVKEHFAVKKQVVDFFKTSWIALEVAQTVKTSSDIASVEVSQPTEMCFLNDGNVERNQDVVEHALVMSNADNLLKSMEFSNGNISIRDQQKLVLVDGSGNPVTNVTDIRYIDSLLVLSTGAETHLYYYAGQDFVYVGAGPNDQAVLSFELKLQSDPTQYQWLGLLSRTKLFTTKITNSGIGAPIAQLPATTAMMDVVRHGAYYVAIELDRIHLLDITETSIDVLDTFTGLPTGTELHRVFSDGEFIYVSGVTNVRVYKIENDSIVEVYVDLYTPARDTMSVGYRKLFIIDGNKLSYYTFDGSVLLLKDYVQVRYAFDPIIYSTTTHTVYTKASGVFYVDNSGKLVQVTDDMFGIDTDLRVQLLEGELTPVTINHFIV